MSEPEFRLVGADLSEESSPSGMSKPCVSLSLRELFPLLASAYQKKAAWLADLADDPVMVTSDLAEILVLYRDVIKEKSA
ncbi:hypothetical protein K2X85_00265 [bacterium]|jgi:hypothetical protein|nr:hypothetical protein [bacterium]